MAAPLPRADNQLPIDHQLAAIVAALGPGATVLLQAPPGAGKTSRVPLAVLTQALAPDERVLMLEPRRLAARAAAQRLALGLGEPLGERIGYSVRLESRTSAATRIEVVTAGLFLRRLQHDPALDGVGCVIFDEFHERQADADLALALVRQSRSLLRPELRLLLMSATLDLAPLANRLDGATVLTSEGRSHPVAVLHQAPREREPLAAQVLRGLEAHWLDHREAGDTVLVFLPGLRELRAARDAIAATPWGADLECCLLHSQLPLAAQAEAIAPARGAAGKVVLATAIAESSLTLAGVQLVIDSGLSRASRFDPSTGMDGLVTRPASQASAEQRRGRAGRLGPGRCLRLWSPGEQQRRPAFDPPELLEVDPLPIALHLAEWGAGLGDDLPWLDPPPHQGLRGARALLEPLQALAPAGMITAHGRAMARLGLHPRLAHMLLQANRHGWLELGCALAVVLSERDPLDGRAVGADLMPRLDWLQGAAGSRSPNPQLRQLLQVQRQLQRQVLAATGDRRSPRTDAKASAADSELSEDVRVALMLSWAYPERIALARGQGDGRFLLRSGHGARLHPSDPLAACPALAVAKVDGAGQDARILLAVVLPPAVLEDLATEQGVSRNDACWDPASQRVRCERSLRLGALVLERQPWPEAEPAAILEALITGLKELGLQALPWTPSSQQLQQRLALAFTHLGPPWPDRRWTTLGSTLAEWLAPHLIGLRSRQDLLQLDLHNALWGDLSWQQRQQLDQWLPTTLTVASGRAVTLDYTSGEPILAVKLQELFGTSATPTLLEGRLPLTVHLLSPAGRPAAITRDLAGFWTSGYPEVRRQLRGRYPKHPWPEDPRQATATALTKARLAQVERTAP